MSAQDRLAAIIAEHQRSGQHLIAGGGAYSSVCLCGAWFTGDDLRQLDAAMGAHVAAVIAGSDDLAVIELPKPDDSVASVWRPAHAAQCRSVTGTYVRARYWPSGPRVGAHGVEDMSLVAAVEVAAGILAAAKAAEGVSDR